MFQKSKQVACEYGKGIYTRSIDVKMIGFAERSTSIVSLESANCVLTVQAILNL